MYRLLSIRSIRLLLSWFAILSILGLTSCGKGKQTTESKLGTEAPFDLDAVLTKYSKADHYSDQARVVLNYCLNGTAFEEIHPCTFEGSHKNVFRFHRFNLEVVSDSKITVARIHDPKTQNLGGQVLCLETPISRFWESLAGDSIADHFANGNDHIPWNAKFKSNRISELLNTTYLLFTGQPPDWMSPNCLESTDRVVVDGKAYDDVTFKSSFGSIACRFDAETRTLLGIRLPTQLLAPEISTAQGVSNVSLALVFENGTFEKGINGVPQLGRYEHPVSRFVQLPEEFPSPSIGKKMVSFDLVSVQDHSPANSIQGTPAVLFFGMQSQYGPMELEQIEELSNDLAFARFAWVDPLAAANTDRPFKFTRLEELADLQGKLYQQIGISGMAFLVVTDAQGTIQFVSARENGWLDNVRPVLNRIRNGDNVAREMHNEYSDYFAKYEAELSRVRANAAVVKQLRRD